MIFCLKATPTFECRPFDVKSLLYYSLIDGYDYNIFAVLMCAIESQAYEYMLHHFIHSCSPSCQCFSARRANS